MKVVTDGCIECDDDDGLDVLLNQTCKTIVCDDGLMVDPDALKGTGLQVEGNCKIAAIPYTGGCGIIVSNFEISVDHDQLIGTAIGAEGLCGLGVKYDCGLTVNPANELEVYATDLCGDYLEESDEPDSCSLNVKDLRLPYVVTDIKDLELILDTNSNTLCVNLKFERWSEVYVLDNDETDGPFDVTVPAPDDGSKCVDVTEC